MITEGHFTAEDRLNVAHGVIAEFVRQFPERLRACYLLGSAADGSALATSDIDITLIFTGAFAEPDERDAARQLGTAFAHQAPVELDIEVTDEQTLALGVEPNLKYAAMFLYGDDIRDQLTLMSITDWTRDRMHSSWWRIARLFARPTIITLPLDYPEPEPEFLGYTRRTVHLPDGGAVPSTRNLIRLVGWAATALLAYDCGVYVASKRDAHVRYHEDIGGPWDAFITDVYEMLRVRWAYLIPEEPEQRAQLRDLCKRTLAFERYFLSRYNPYLIAELTAGGDRALFACDVMQRAPLAEPAVLGALHALLQAPEETVQEAARAALTALKPIP